MPVVPSNRIARAFKVWAVGVILCVAAYRGCLRCLMGQGETHRLRVNMGAKTHTINKCLNPQEVSQGPPPTPLAWLRAWQRGLGAGEGTHRA